MTEKNPAVDAYIAKAAPFAQPILERLRSHFHAGAKDLREELKWGVPHFTRNGIVCGMAAFKQHVAFGFWRSKEMDDPEGLFAGGAKASMCNVKVATVKELPTKKALTAYVKQAVALDEAFEQPAAKKARATKKKATGKRPPPKCPADLMAALKKVKKALATYEGFPPGKQRDYVDWVEDAKREATREKRIAQAVEWMAEGKSRHWKYESC